MRAYISADDNLEGHFRDYNENCNGPLSSRLRARFDRICVMQQQRANESSDNYTDDLNGDDEEDLSEVKEEKSVDDTGDFVDHASSDDDYYEALFSSPSSVDTSIRLSETSLTIPSHTHSGNKRPRMNVSSYSSLALSTSILAQREIEEAQNRIAELERSFRCMTENQHDNLGSPSLLPKEDEDEVDDGADRGWILGSFTSASHDGKRCIGANDLVPSSVG